MRLTGLERVEVLLAKLRGGGEGGSRGASQDVTSGRVPPPPVNTAGRRSAERERASTAQPIVVNYTPNVTMENRGEQGLERRLLEVLERHGYELAEVLRREAAKRQRGEF